MHEALLDTDILSEVLKRKDRRVLDAVRKYLSEHERLAFSAITAYEILRGLQARSAERQFAAFRKTIKSSMVIAADLRILMRAAQLWADARLAGHPHDDADLAATLDPRIARL